LVLASPEVIPKMDRLNKTLCMSLCEVTLNNVSDYWVTDYQAAGLRLELVVR